MRACEKLKLFLHFIFRHNLFIFFSRRLLLLELVAFLLRTSFPWYLILHIYFFFLFFSNYNKILLFIFFLNLQIVFRREKGLLLIIVLIFVQSENENRMKCGDFYTDPCTNVCLIYPHCTPNWDRLRRTKRTQDEWGPNKMKNWFGIFGMAPHDKCTKVKTVKMTNRHACTTLFANCGQH